MKYFLIPLLLLGMSTIVSAQEAQLQKGNFVIDANTTLGNIGGLGGIGGVGTGFLLSTVDGATIWNAGGEVGYFVTDELALKTGLGVGDFDGLNLVSYKFGAKYYIAQKIPFQLDVSGQSIEDLDDNPFYIAFQGGYALFLGDMVSIEPSLRYNISTTEFFENIFQIQIGFSIFL